MNDGALFDLPGEPGERATCRTCRIEPVKWMPRRQIWSIYCGSNSCISPFRLCKNCDERFDTAQGGSKYCSVECRETWHAGAYARAIVTRNQTCSRPGCENLVGNRKLRTLGLCTPCYGVIKPVAGRLQIHRVPLEMVLTLFTDPVCWNPACRVPLLGPGRPLLVIDHDHRCCHGSHSCGRCVRGFLCPHCNTGAAHLRDDADLAAGIAVYLREYAIAPLPSHANGNGDIRKRQYLHKSGTRNDN